MELLEALKVNTKRAKLTKEAKKMAPGTLVELLDDRVSGCNEMGTTSICTSCSEVLCIGFHILADLASSIHGLTSRYYCPKPYQSYGFVFRNFKNSLR